MKNRQSGPPAFTLIELLVVISIIALLLSVLMPALQKAKQSSQQVICRNNLRQWAMAINAFSFDNKGQLPLSTVYSVAAGKVTAGYPNEMYLDRFARQYSLAGTPAERKAWQEKMISHEAIAPYLPGFNNMGLRTDRVSEFKQYENNFLLDGVWRCPQQKKRDIGTTMAQLTDSYRSYFRLDYAYIGRTDLWSDSMFPQSIDRGALVGPYPDSRKIMLTDTVFYWEVGSPADKIYLYNHGKHGPSSEGAVSSLKSPQDISGINQAFGDGSVRWKPINSDDRFRSDGFKRRINRHVFLGYQGYLFF